MTSDTEPIVVSEPHERVYGLGEHSAMRTQLADGETVAWVNHAEIPEAISCFAEVVRAGTDADPPPSALFITRTGFADRTSGESPVLEQIGRSASTPEATGTLRIECTLASVGRVAVAFRRVQPGLEVNGHGSISITASSLNDAVLLGVYEKTASKLLLEECPDLVGPSAP